MQGVATECWEPDQEMRRIMQYFCRGGVIRKRKIGSCKALIEVRFREKKGSQEAVRQILGRFQERKRSYERTAEWEGKQLMFIYILDKNQYFWMII